MLALACFVSMLGPGPTEAEPPAWVRWDAPDACPAASDLAQAVRARLGRSPTEGEIEVAASIEDRNADGLHLTLETTSNGQRDRHTMTAHDCRALTDAAALVVALSIDPMAVVAATTVVDEREAEPEGPPMVPPLVEPPLVEPLPPEPSPEPPPDEAARDDLDNAPRSGPVPPESRAGADAPGLRAPEGLLGIAGGAEIGALPGVTGGPSVTFALAWPRLRVELGGTWLAPRTTTGGEARVRVMLGVATVRACGRLRGERIEVPLCAGLEAGAGRGRGLDAPNPRVANGTWLAPTVGAGVLGWVIPRLAVFGRAEVAVPVLRAAYDVREPGEPQELFRPGAASGRLWVGIEARLW